MGGGLVDGSSFHGGYLMEGDLVGVTQVDGGDMMDGDWSIICGTLVYCY